MSTLLTSDIGPFLLMVLVMTPIVFIVICTRSDNARNAQDFFIWNAEQQVIMCDSCQCRGAIAELRYTDGTIYNVCQGCTPTAQVVSIQEARRGRHGALR